MTDTRSSFRKHARLLIVVGLASVLALVIGCGGSGGGSVAGTATTATNVSTATTNTTATTATSSGTIPPGTLPSNVIFYVDGAVGSSSSTPFGSEDIFYISPTGTNQALYVTVPTNVAAAASNPSVQSQFVFAATSDGTNYNIYSNTTLSTVGAKTIVSTSVVGVDAIAVSPDGNNVFYSAEDANGDETIYKVALTGGTPIPLYLGDDPEVDGSNTYLAFDQPDPSTSNNYIFMSKLDGTGVKQLTSGTGANDFLPQWSKPTSSTPTPAMIAFNRADGTQSSIEDVYTVNTSTKVVTQVTTSPDSGTNGLLITGPSWSPDNSTLSFYAQPIDLGAIVFTTGLYTGPSSPSSPYTPATVAGTSSVQAEPVSSISVVLGESETYWTDNSGRSPKAGHFFEFRRKHGKHTRGAAKK